MPDAVNPQTEHQSKLLVVALEVLRRTLTESVSFLFANRERPRAAPEWARQAIAPPDSPAAAHRGEDIYQPVIPPSVKPAKSIPLATEAAAPVAPTFNIAAPGATDDRPIPLAPDRKPETFNLAPEKAAVGAFGIGGDKASPVSAFDRPQAVIIVGPNPLPVSMDLSNIGGPAARATTPRAERPASGEGGALSVAKAIGTRFLAVLGPLYALSTVLQQTNSGVGVFGKAVNVLGATLAPLLLPVFAMLAAGVLSVADMLWSKLLPALGKFYEWALKFGIPAAEEAVGKAEDTIDTGVAAKNLVTKGEAPKIEDVPRMAKQLLPPGADFILRNLDQTIPAQIAKQFTGAEPKIPESPRGTAAFGGETETGKPKLGELFSQNMRDVIRSLAMSMGPKASYVGLGEVGKQAQLAALNADPIEMKAAQRVIASIQEFQKAWEDSQRKREADEQLNRREPKR